MRIDETDNALISAAIESLREKLNTDVIPTLLIAYVEAFRKAFNKPRYTYFNSAQTQDFRERSNLKLFF